MTEPTNALLPCPFCGEGGQLMRRSELLSDEALQFWVACASDKCKVVCRSSMESEPESAIAAWNTRTTPASQEALMRAANQAVYHWKRDSGSVFFEDAMTELSKALPQPPRKD